MQTWISIHRIRLPRLPVFHVIVCVVTVVKDKRMTFDKFIWQVPRWIFRQTRDNASHSVLSIPTQINFIHSNFNIKEWKNFTDFALLYLILHSTSSAHLRGPRKKLWRNKKEYTEFLGNDLHWKVCNYVWWWSLVLVLDIFVQRRDVSEIVWTVTNNEIPEISTNRFTDQLKQHTGRIKDAQCTYRGDICS